MCPRSESANVKRRQDIARLRNTPLFRAINENSLAQLLQSGPHREFKRGASVVVPDPDDIVCIVACGLVRASLLSIEGRPLVVHYFRTGSVFGLGDFDSGEAVCDDTIIYALRWPALLASMCSSPPAIFELIADLHQRSNELRTLLRAVAFDRMRVRLGRVLVSLAHADGLVTETHRELAARVGAEREDVTKALGDFHTRGLIQSIPHRHGIYVLRGHELQN